MLSAPQTLPVGRSVVLGSGGRVIPDGRMIPSVLEGVSVGLGGRMIESVLEGPSVIVPVPEVELVEYPLDVAPDGVGKSDEGELSLIVAESVGVSVVSTEDRESVLVSGGGMLLLEVDELSVTPVLDVRVDSIPMRVMDEKELDNTPVPVPGGTVLLLFAGTGNGGGL